jgi:hypothetical protein
VVQKQALLQWGWDWEQNYSEKAVESNAKKIAKAAGIKIATEMLENIELPAFTSWK